MAEKKWRFEEFIRLGDLKSLMVDFELATNLSVALYDDKTNLIYGKFSKHKICSGLIELPGTKFNCCDMLQIDDDVKSCECSIVKCGLGLSSFIIPITSSRNEPIGYIVGEPVFLSKETKHDFLNIFKDGKYRSKDFAQDKVRELLREIDVMSPENYKAKANFLLNSVNILIQNSIQKDEIEQVSMLLSENHILRKKSEDGVNTLLTLFEVSKNINTITDLKVLLNCIVNSITKLLNADMCSVLLTNENTGALEIAAGHDASGPFAANCPMPHGDSV